MGYFLTSACRERVAGMSSAQPKTHTPFSRVKERGRRYYSPNLGRWLSRDPIGARGGRNLYSFVKNASVNLTDPLGLVGTITVTTFEQLVSDSWFWHERGWWFTAIWNPPSGGDWDKPCECKPCRKVVWLQKAAWYLERPSPIPSVFVPWHEEWSEADAANYGTIWDCTTRSTNAGIGDYPGFGVLFLGTVRTWDFVAESYVKCVEGKDAGTVYGKVKWDAHWTYDTLWGFAVIQ